MPLRNEDRFENPIATERMAAMNDLLRDSMAHFCLGDVGEHFDEAEWNRRADLLHNDPVGYLNGRYDDA